MKNLYKLEVDCGRMGYLEGLFIAEEEDIKKIMGKQIYFGEVLGKHSEISAEMDNDCLSALTNDQDFISKFEEFHCASGYNPLDYIDEEDE